MKKQLVAAAFAAGMISAPAMAQDEAPDGSRAFGIEPYVAVMGGVHNFDDEVQESGIPPENYDARIVEGIVGVNVPLGAFFVGAEGNVTKGISGDIDWEYGAAGRAGVRVGESGMFYGKVGYQWVNFDRGSDSPDYDAMMYGIGFEVGPKEIGLGGITGESGIRLRGEVQTYDDFLSLRPTLGVVAHF